MWSRLAMSCLCDVMRLGIDVASLLHTVHLFVPLCRVYGVVPSADRCAVCTVSRGVATLFDRLVLCDVM